MGIDMYKKVKANFKKYMESEEAYIEELILNMQNFVFVILDEANETQTSLAEKIGMKKQQFNAFLSKGHNATLKTIGKIAFALNKKAVISFVDKNTNSKDFYEYVKKYKSFR